MKTNLRKRLNLLLLIATFLMSAVNLIKAQETPYNPENTDNIQNQNIELLSEQNQEEETDYTTLVEQWKYYLDHPINLNRTTKDELDDLQLLTEFQINNLFTHLQKNGNLISIYELQGIEGFDLQTIKKILPYVKVKDQFDASHFSINEMFKNGKIDLVSRIQFVLEDQKGYESHTDSMLRENPNDYYLGSKQRIYNRFRFSYSNNVSVGFISEKDAGEPFRKIDSLNKKAGFDFYTFHFFIRNIKFIKSLAIGDYQAGFGQGLTMWRGFGFGKSSAIVNMKRNPLGLRAYNSVDENRFLRGAATTLKFGKIELSGFYSRKKIDANANYDTTINGAIDVEEISSIIATGSHATIGELKDKDVISETLFGGNISYKGKRLTLGATSSYFELSTPLNKDLGLYNKYDFEGRSNWCNGVDFSYVHKNMNFFGEGALSSNGGKAILGGVIVALDPRVTFTAYYRNFDKKYQNLNALAVSENTLPQNEQGIYLGTEIKLPKNFTFTTYYDQYKFPWLKYQTYAPSAGNDFFAQLNWTPNKKTDMYFRYRNRKKQENGGSENLYDLLVNVQQQNYRYNVSFQLLPYLKLRTRIEYLQYFKEQKTPESGILVFQDVVFKKIGSPIEVTARYGLFETDSYDSRVYSYENDVLYSFSIPALYDKGSRAYLMIDYSITRNIELWARISQTFYTNRNIQSEGSLTQINGPKKTELKLQVRFRFN